MKIIIDALLEDYDETQIHFMNAYNQGKLDLVYIIKYNDGFKRAFIVMLRTYNDKELIKYAKEKMKDLNKKHLELNNRLR